MKMLQDINTDSKDLRIIKEKKHVLESKASIREENVTGKYQPISTVLGKVVSWHQICSQCAVKIS